MIPVSVPLIFPKIVPDNWDEWLKIWEKNKKFVPKIEQTPNAGQALWFGFDIYVKEGIDADKITKYHCENLNCPELFPSLFDNLDKFPMDIYVVRVLQSISKVQPHQDYPLESNSHSIRTLLLDTNDKPNWFYTLSDDEKIYLKLPKETNTWYYKDSLIKHGTDFNPGKFKQLIVYRGKIKEQQLNDLLRVSISKYENYSILI